MIPYPGQTLRDLALRIATDIAPATQTPFAAADSGLLTGLLLAMAQDYERAIYNPMADIDDVRQLCRQMLALEDEARPDFDALAECAQLLEAEPASLMLEDVTALHAQALNLLIVIHSWAEVHHATIDLAAWQVLRRYSERHKFDIPGP